MNFEPKRKAKRLTRKNLSEEYVQTGLWPEPDTSGWSAKDTQRYYRVKGAIVDYIGGQKVTVIEHRYKLSISQVQEQLWRAVQFDGDNQILGFNALIPNLQVVETRRRKPMPSGMHPNGPLCTGGLKYILLAENLYNAFEDRVLKRGPGPHPAVVSPLDVQTWIAGELERRGYKKTDYPFNTRRPLYSSIVRLIGDIQKDNYAEHVSANEEERAAGNLTVLNGRSGRQPRPPPLDEVEADEHKLHGIACVRITVDGVDKLIPTERAVGIAIVCRGTRAILGGSVCLNPEAKEGALIEAIRSAVIPGYVLRLPNGEPAPLFRLCDFQPAFEGAVWNVMHLDNARIHTGDAYQRTARQIGNWTCFGVLGSWSARPNIEGTFAQQVLSEFRKAPSTTGCGEQHSGRKTPADEAMRWEIEHVDLCRLFFSGLAKINQEVAQGVLFQPPSQVVSNYFTGKYKPIVRRLPPITASRPEVGVEPVRRRVKRRGKDNPNLYVSYAGAKYTNDVLADRADLYGEFIILHPRPNLRAMLAFQLNGTPLGELKADGHWGESDHTLEIRRAVNRDKDLRFGQHGDSTTPIERLLQDTAKKVLTKSKRRKRGEVVKGGLELQRQLEATSTVEMHVSAEQKKAVQEVNVLTVSVAAERARQMLRARSNRTGEDNDA